MIIECPYCHAQYDLGPETSLEGRKVRCSQCHHVWQPGDEPTLAPFEPQPNESDSPARHAADAHASQADSAAAPAMEDQATGAASEGAAGAPSSHDTSDQGAREDEAEPILSDEGPANENDAFASRMAAPPPGDAAVGADRPDTASAREMPGGAGPFGESLERAGRRDAFGEPAAADVSSGEPQAGQPAGPAGGGTAGASEEASHPDAAEFGAPHGPYRDTDPAGRHTDNLAERMAREFEKVAGSQEFDAPATAPGSGGFGPSAAGPGLHASHPRRDHQPTAFGTAIARPEEHDVPFNARNSAPNGDTDMAAHDQAAVGPHMQGEAPQAAVNGPANLAWDEEWLYEGAAQEGPAGMAEPGVAQRRGGGWKAAIGWLVLIVAVGGGAALALMRPNAVVAALPGTAKVYEALGHTVNIRGLRFDDVEYRWVRDQSAPALEISGSIRNITADPVAVPIVVFVLLDAEGGRVFKWAERVRRAPLPGGKASRFTARVPAPPQLVRKLRVRFAKHG